MSSGDQCPGGRTIPSSKSELLEFSKDGDVDFQTSLKMENQQEK